MQFIKLQKKYKHENCVQRGKRAKDEYINSRQTLKLLRHSTIMCEKDLKISDQKHLIKKNDLEIENLKKQNEISSKELLLKDEMI